jgi:hypothetical protein
MVGCIVLVSVFALSSLFLMVYRLTEDLLNPTYLSHLPNHEIREKVSRISVLRNHLFDKVSPGIRQEARKEVQQLGSLGKRLSIFNLYLHRDHMDFDALLVDNHWFDTCHVVWMPLLFNSTPDALFKVYIRANQEAANRPAERVVVTFLYGDRKPALEVVCDLSQDDKGASAKVLQYSNNWANRFVHEHDLGPLVSNAEVAEDLFWVGVSSKVNNTASIKWFRVEPLPVLWQVQYINDQKKTAFIAALQWDEQVEPEVVVFDSEGIETRFSLTSKSREKNSDFEVVVIRPE